MSKISTSEECRKALSSLSLAQQRQVGARFVANVLDLTDDPQVKNGQEIAGKPGVTADELNDAYNKGTRCLRCNASKIRLHISGLQATG
jgi:hypothetical protein